MDYITLLALLDALGADWLAQRSAPTNPAVDDVLLQLTVEGGDRSTYSADDQAAADKAVALITNTLNDAGKTVDSYLRERHILPLDQSLIEGSSLGRQTAVITRYYLSGDLVTEETRNGYKDAIAWLRDVRSGRATLGQEDTTPTTSGRVVMRSGASSIDWSSY